MKSQQFTSLVGSVFISPSCRQHASTGHSIPSEPLAHGSGREAAGFPRKARHARHQHKNCCAWLQGCREQHFPYGGVPLLSCARGVRARRVREPAAGQRQGGRLQSQAGRHGDMRKVQAA